MQRSGIHTDSLKPHLLQNRMCAPFFTYVYAFQCLLMLALCFQHTCRLSDPLQYQSIVDAEWNIIYDKLDKCVKSGAKIVLSRLAIGDLATQVA